MRHIRKINVPIRGNLPAFNVLGRVRSFYAHGYSGSCLYEYLRDRVKGSDTSWCLEARTLWVEPRLANSNQRTFHHCRPLRDSNYGG